MASIREVPSKGRLFERIGAHTHIKGLGLDENLKAVKVKDGMVGQERAREAAGLVVQMIKEGKLSGKTMILAGPPGTGKTAIAVAISKELGANVPFIQMSGSEVYSSERKKTEILYEAIRKCIGVEIHEMREVYEGEVTSIDIRTAPHPYNPYQKVPESIRLGLKTTKEEKTIEAGATIAQQIIQENISEGNVIQIDKETGRVVNLGIGLESAKGKTYDVDTRRKIPRPDGKSLLGFPLDLVDRSVIIGTEEYDAESIREILRLRSLEEKVKIEKDAIEKLTQIGAGTSLRYAVQLLSLAAQNARAMKHEKVSIEDVERVDKLFMDVGEAAEHLRKYEEKLMHH